MAGVSYLLLALLLIISLGAATRKSDVEQAGSPQAFPGSGTFAGSVSVSLSSATPAATIYYALSHSGSDGPDPSTSSDSVDNNGDVTIAEAGSWTLKAMAAQTGYGNSGISTYSYTVLPKVDAVSIVPTDQTIFSESALLSFYCGTAGASIHYTTDGADPSVESPTVSSGGSVTLSEAGRSYIIKAFATKEGMFQSDVVKKTVSILHKSPAPLMRPAASGSSTIGDLEVFFVCDGTGATGAVYYTFDSSSKPSTETWFSVPCGGSVLLEAPGIFTLRAFAVLSGDSESTVSQGVYSLVRPAYDEFDANSAFPFQVRPEVEVFVVEKKLRALSGFGCDERAVRGRLVLLHNPIGHFDVVEPAGGCGRSLVLPSESGRAYAPPQAGWDLSRNSSLLEKSRIAAAAKMGNVMAANGETVRVWREQFAAGSSLGCEVVSNGGFFNTTSNACMGDIVTDSVVRQSSAKRNVNFGLRGDKFVTGYVDPEEEGARAPFDSLISGIGWLVRGGESYIQESLSVSGDAEDLSGQSTGAQFASVVSARTALGHSETGALLLLQVEGQTWERGMSLYEFADFAVELGFYSAINLDGGGSATMTVNHTLVSEPSWACEEGGDDLSSASNLYGYYHCEKPVSTITCIHSMAPPAFPAAAGGPSAGPAQQVSPSPSALPQTPSPAPSGSSLRTAYPTYAWQRSDDYGGSGGGYPDSPADSNSTAAADAPSYDAIVSDLGQYRTATYALAFALCLSIAGHIYVFYRASEAGSGSGSGGSSSLLFESKGSGKDRSGGIQMSPLHTPGSQGGSSSSKKAASTSDSISNAIFNLTPAMPALSSRRTGINSLTSGGGDWQSKLKNINFDRDSSDDDDMDDASRGRRGGGGIETVELYSTHLPQMAGGKRRGKKGAKADRAPKNSSAYAILGSDDEEEGGAGGGNPFRSK